jgi:hypothetical protein
MSDLSRVLGDLYRGDDADSRPSVAPPRDFRTAAAAPEWADEDRLDQAFENWTPGPPPEAPALEHEMSSYVIDAPAVPPAHLEDDLTTTIGEALAQAGPESTPDVPVAGAVDPLSFEGYAVDAAVVPPAPAPAPSLPADVAAELPVFAEPVPAAPVVADGPWKRWHDDILPGKKGAAPAAKAPKSAKSHKVSVPKLSVPKVKLPALKLRKK